MTPIFCCGFECGQFIASSTNSHWQSIVGSPVFSTTTVRSGARSFRANASASTCQIQSFSWTGSLDNVGRLYIYFATLPDADCTLVNLVRSIRFKSSDSKLYTWDGSSFIGSGVSVTTGVWYRIEWKYDHTGTTFDAQVDGVALGQISAALSITFLNLGVLTTCTADVFFDDVVISQTGADYPIGAGYVNHFVCTSDGTHNIAGAGDFERTLTGVDILNSTTTAYQLIDDVPLESGAGVDWQNMVAPPNATDYVECVFGPAPGISTPTVGPRAVEVILGYHQAGTGLGNMEVRMNDNGTTDATYSATAVAGVTSIAYKRKQYATAIAGGGAWTVVSGNGNFNDLRVRFGSPAAVDANPDQYFDCIMIEAEFATATPATAYLLVKN